MKLWVPIAVAAIVAGSLDLIYACIHLGGYWGLTPTQIFQSIARGVLGPAASKGGLMSASLGFALEYVLTAIMAGVYIVSAQWLKDLRRFWWLLGPCYGIILMCAMYWVVLPLAATHGNSAMPDSRPGPDGKVSDHQILYGAILAHMFLVGLPIAAAARFLWPKAKAAEKA